MKAKQVNAPVRHGWVSVLALALPLFTFAQEFSEQRLRQACEALQASPLEAGDLQILAEASRSTTTSPSLRSRAMAAFSLTFLMQGNTNAFDRACQMIRTTFPDAVSLIKVTRDDCFVQCQDCKGSEKLTTLCPVCMGTGKCKTCLGTGRKEGAKCSVCKGKSDCGMCSGKKRITIPCPTCKGTSIVFKPKESIRTNFNALLSEISSICQEYARFAEQYRIASAETDLAKRIELFKALIESFPHHPDIRPAIGMLQQAINAQKAEASRLQAKNKREREELEKEDLLKLRDARARDLNSAIATLITYLKANPDCAAQLELQVLADELIARRNRAECLRKILFGLAALLGLLVVLAVLKPLLFRKKTAVITPLPGMDKIDMAHFTDPLKLTADESKSRAKTPPPTRGA